MNHVMLLCYSVGQAEKQDPAKKDPEIMQSIASIYLILLFFYLAETSSATIVPNVESRHALLI